MSSHTSEKSIVQLLPSLTPGVVRIRADTGRAGVNLV